jgi:hypothetical protein
MRSVSTWTAGVVLAVVVTACSGCAAVLVAGGAAAGAGGVLWYQGALRTTVGYPITQVRETTAEALRKAGDGIVLDEGGAIDRELAAWLPGGDKVAVKLHAASSTATEISIRIGVMGDQERSQTLHDDIIMRLNAPKL